MIPVGIGQPTTIIDEIQSRHCRNIGKARGSLAEIQKPAMALPPAKGLAIAQHRIDGGPALIIRQEFARRLAGQRSLRHDLSPEETSQIAGVRRGHKAISGVNILPAIVIQIDEKAPPRPASHFDLGSETLIAKAAGFRL